MKIKLDENLLKARINRLLEKEQSTRGEFSHADKVDEIEYFIRNLNMCVPDVFFFYETEIHDEYGEVISDIGFIYNVRYSAKEEMNKND